MFELEKTFRFESAHKLVHHDGKCRELHGHSYIGSIVLRSAELIETGPKKNMVMDFGDISDILKPMIERYLDHHYLNDTLGSDSTTAEFIAKWIYDYLKPKMPMLYAVTVYETHTSKATYKN